MKVLAVDPGDKNLGLAVSDDTGTLARPLTVIPHVSMDQDVQRIAGEAAVRKVEIVVIGAAFGGDGEETRAVRHAQRLLEHLQLATSLKCVLWDESGTTQAARNAAVRAGKPKHRRRGHHDAMAAAIMLQDYLDAIREEKCP